MCVFPLWLKYTTRCIFLGGQTKFGWLCICVLCAVYAVHMCPKIEQTYNHVYRNAACWLRLIMTRSVHQFLMGAKMFHHATTCTAHMTFEYIELIYTSSRATFLLIAQYHFICERNYSLHYEIKQLGYFNDELLFEVIEVSERKRLQKLQQFF